MKKILFAITAIAAITVVTAISLENCFLSQNINKKSEDEIKVINF